MKKTVNVIFFVFAFFAISGAYADQSPESLVTCGGAAYSVLSHSLAGVVNTELCTEKDTCATCIPSLEEQGCKVINVIPKPVRYHNEAGELNTVTYFLSCSRP